MSFRKKFNRLLKPFGYELAKCHMGRHAWQDVCEFIAPYDARLIFDVGANEGQSGLEFLEIFPDAQVHSFEPAPDVCQRLNEQASRYDRWTVHALALGSEPGESTFHLNAFHQTNSLLPRAEEGRAYVDQALECVETRKVPVRTLDAVAEEMQAETIDLLKIDTQGYELHVLKGAEKYLSEQRINAVSLEVNFAPLYEGQAAFEELHAFLHGHRYRLVGLYDNAYSPQKHLMWCDMLYTPLR